MNEIVDLSEFINALKKLPLEDLEKDRRQTLDRFNLLETVIRFKEDIKPSILK